MDLFNSLKVFVRVVEGGSFTAAANALDISTAQVSRLVSELEQHLQARLLQRTTRRISLTDVGERFLPRGRRILEEMEEATEQARGAHLKPAGRLRVHTMTALGTLMTPLIARYCEQYPEVVFELSLSQRHPDVVEDAQDVVISIAPGLPDSQFIAHELGRIYSVPCASPAYIQAQGAPAVPSDLQHHRCLRLIDPLYGDDWLFNDPEGEHLIKPDKTFQCNVADAMVGASEAGMGVSLLPFYVTTRALTEGTLLRLLGHHRLRERSVYAIYPSRRFLDAKVRTWIEFLKLELPKLFAEHEQILQNVRYWA
ncbi:LysR family transcriptional regulator [Pseudomonas sp. TE3610]